MQKYGRNIYYEGRMIITMTKIKIYAQSRCGDDHGDPSYRDPAHFAKARLSQPCYCKILPICSDGSGAAGSPFQTCPNYSFFAYVSAKKRPCRRSAPFNWSASPLQREILDLQLMYVTLVCVNTFNSAR